jgi:hypothetical protein
MKGGRAPFPLRRIGGGAKGFVTPSVFPWLTGAPYLQSATTVTIFSSYPKSAITEDIISVPNSPVVSDVSRLLLPVRAIGNALTGT